MTARLREFERGYADGFERGWCVGLERLERRQDKPTIPPLAHLPSAVDQRDMSRREIMELMAIKCATIDQQSSRAGAVLKRIGEVLNRSFHSSVPFETAVERLIDELEAARGGKP